MGKDAKGELDTEGKHIVYPIGIRIWSDGQTPDSKPTVLELVVAAVTLTLYTGWLHILLLITVLAIWYPVARLVLALLWATLLLPARPVLWQSFNRSWVFCTWRKWFHFSFNFEELAKADGHYIYVEFPHGVFPMGPLVAGTLCQSLFPDFSIYSLAASSVFSIPGWRHFVAWIGSMPATSANFKYLLRKGSVAVIAGGIAEMFMQHKRKERIMLKNRKGFVRIAVEQGTDGIVPVYHFGNTQLLDIFPEAAASISRKLRAACGFLYGSFGLPTPRRKQVYMVMGKAIPVKKMDRNDPGFEAEVDRVHALVIEALQDLYDRHKGEYGWQDRPLSIE